MLRFSQSPLEQDFVQNPYSFYETLRAGKDLVFWEDYDCIFAISYPAVNYFLRNRHWGREVPAEQRCPKSDHLLPFIEVEKNSLLEIDPPRHTQLRKLIAKAFTSRSISNLEPYILRLSHELIDDLETSCIDIQTHYSEKLPVLVITKLLGVDSGMSDQLLDWSHKMVAMYQANRNRDKEIIAGQAALAFSEFIKAEIKHKIKHPSDDLLSRLVKAEIDGKKLSMSEIISTTILLLNAGHEATTFALGNGISLLAKYNNTQAIIYNKKNLNLLVEEILRFDPPLHIFERYAKEDMQIFDYQFKRNQKANLLLAAANRDSAVFQKPDVFDPTLLRPGNVSLGAGAHFCVGAPLARLEIGIGLQVLFQRFPKLRLIKEPHYADRYHFHGFNELLINLDS